MLWTEEVNVRGRGRPEPALPSLQCGADLEQPQEVALLSVLLSSEGKEVGLFHLNGPLCGVDHLRQTPFKRRGFKGRGGGGGLAGTTLSPSPPPTIFHVPQTL